MARLRKLGKSGRYYLYFSDSARAPREKSLPLGTSDNRAARKRANAVEKMVDRHEFDPWNYSVLPWEASGLSLSRAAEMFVEDRTATCRPATVRAYSLALRQLCDAAPEGISVDGLQSAHVRRYVDAPKVARKTLERGGSPGEKRVPVSDATRRHRYRHVRTFVHWASEQGMLAEGVDPTKGVIMGRPEKRLPAFLTPSDLERVLSAIGGQTELQRAGGHARDGENVWLKPVILVAAYTGLRLGELAAARWSWVDLEGRALTVRHTGGFLTKGKRERTVPLAGPALEAVRGLHAEREARGDVLDGPLFPGPRGTGINPARTSKRFKFFVLLAMLPETLHFHNLRHSCGSMLALKGVPTVIIAEVLGHASQATTTIYTQAAARHVREAMERAYAD